MTRHKRRTRDFAIVFRYLADERIGLIAWNFSMSRANILRIVRKYTCPYRSKQAPYKRRPLSAARMERLGIHCV